MAYSGLKGYITELEKQNELIRIKAFTDPVLEITEITDRIVKSGGKALLFENNGTAFPVLINAFGSDRRMSLAIGRNNLDDAGNELELLFKKMTGSGGSLMSKISFLPQLLSLSSSLPSKSARKGSCQDVVIMDPDLGILPVLKCWPHDGGRFITLPMVHTIHPETGSTNVGMYRMQVIDRNTTGMHWQRHKTGANHFEAWKKKGLKMPVTVTLGGDPVYTYAATAPLPENISEYILAGFLRKQKVKLVRCITNQLYVPSDADIVIEGYVDPSEELFWEGPFGDHTGFYSLADWYPKFHVTCISHSGNAIYPATIVGIPPMEDAWLAKTTEKIFLAPVKMAMQPEIEDFHMPDAGVAHNLTLVKIRKNYPGQGMKVISSLFGAGQMMFTKYLVVISGEVEIRNYPELLAHIFQNTDLERDLLFCRGPLDVLDHSSDSFSFGGKVGIDATIKHHEELPVGNVISIKLRSEEVFNPDPGRKVITDINSDLCDMGIPVIVIAVNSSEDPDAISKAHEMLREPSGQWRQCLIIAVDHPVDVRDYHTVAWQLFGDSDPLRDHEYLSDKVLFLDGTIKGRRGGSFPRRWPNVVCAAEETIGAIDAKWEFLALGPYIPSPSLKYINLIRKGKDSISLE